MWDIFEPVPMYDEIAHVVTPFVLVAIVAEIVYRSGGDDEFFGTPRRAPTPPTTSWTGSLTARARTRTAAAYAESREAPNFSG